MGPRALAIAEVAIRDLRNLVAVDAELCSGLNVVHGDNGQGKTTFLEAVYLAASSRSFRTARLREVVRHGQPSCSVRLTVSERHRDGGEAVLREQSTGISGGRTTVRVDGQRPSSLAAFATRTPVVVFHPDELALSTGPATLRRRLLDRLVLYRDPLGADALARFTRALRARQDLLRRGVRSGSALDAYEALCASEGARLTRARGEASAVLVAPFRDAFSRIGEPGLGIGVAYAPGGSDDPEIARSELAAGRDRDAHRASAGFGPHRDDLVLELSGHPARAVASQGQHRALVLALKAAESETVADATGLTPILLLDDVSSELDPTRTAALFAFLGRTLRPTAAGRQIVLTTTRPELIPEALSQAADHAHSRRDFAMSRGRLETRKFS